MAPRQVAFAVFRGAEDVGTIRCLSEFGPGPAWADPSPVGKTAVWQHMDSAREGVALGMIV